MFVYSEVQHYNLLSQLAVWKILLGRKHHEAQIMKNVSEHSKSVLGQQGQSANGEKLPDMKPSIIIPG